MKGLYWKQNSSGEETNFVFLEKDNLPVVKDNYVKVRVRACALSRIDTKLLSDIKLEKEFLPVGREVAGVVLEIGNKVSSFQPNDEVVARIIDESNGKYDLTESCLEETGGLGVDIILDAGVRSHNKEDKVASQELLPHKHDIITLLSVGGHWVTMEENLQLDPPDSRCLFLKGASVSFLNDEVWNLSNMQQGKYLCILEDIMEKLSSGIFRPLLDEPIPLYEAKVSMEMVQKNQARKKQVVQL